MGILQTYLSGSRGTLDIAEMMKYTRQWSSHFRRQRCLLEERQLQQACCNDTSRSLVFLSASLSHQPSPFLSTTRPILRADDEYRTPGRSPADANAAGTYITVLEEPSEYFGSLTRFPRGFPVSLRLVPETLPVSPLRRRASPDLGLPSTGARKLRMRSRWHQQILTTRRCRCYYACRQIARRACKHRLGDLRWDARALLLPCSR